MMLVKEHLHYTMLLGWLKNSTLLSLGAGRNPGLWVYLHKTSDDTLDRNRVNFVILMLFTQLHSKYEIDVL